MKIDRAKLDAEAQLEAKRIHIIATEEALKSSVKRYFWSDVLGKTITKIIELDGLLVFKFDDGYLALQSAQYDSGLESANLDVDQLATLGFIHQDALSVLELARRNYKEAAYQHTLVEETNKRLRDLGIKATVLEIKARET